MLYTTEEFALYIGKSSVEEINAPRAELIRDLVEIDIRLEVGDTRFEAVDPVRFKPVALDMAKRSYINTEGLRSIQESLDDYSKMITYASETVAPPEMTGDERARIRKAAGIKGVFTVTPTSPPACPPRRVFPTTEEY